MKDYLRKLKYILLPYLACLFLVVICYTLWNWFLCVELRWIKIEDTITDVLIPMAITAAVVLFYMRKSINRLYFKKADNRGLFYVIMIMAICAPLLIAQHYMNTATGHVTHLEKISDIDHEPETKYYTLANYSLYLGGASIDERVETSGKRNQNLDLYIYCVVPIMEKSQDTLNYETHYWYCKRYHKRINNHISDDQKRAAWDKFQYESGEQFKQETFYFTYLERLKNQRDAIFYGHAASHNNWARNGEDVLLIPRQGEYEHRNGYTLLWVFLSAGIGIIVIALLLLCFRLKAPEEWDRYTKKIRREQKTGWQKYLVHLIPREGFFITPILVYVLLFIAACLALRGDGLIKTSRVELISWESLYALYIQGDGEYWRMLTYMFLHGGLLHLLNNIVSLVLIGFIIEPLLGSFRFLIVYIICGLGASLVTMIADDYINTVGADGAIFGLYGIAVIMLLMKFIKEYPNPLLILLACFSIGCSIVLGITTHVDGVAQIGGFVTGILVGFLVLPFLEPKEKVLLES